jgi:hypothetical protein
MKIHRHTFIPAAEEVHADWLLGVVLPSMGVQLG